MKKQKKKSEAEHEENPQELLLRYSFFKDQGEAALQELQRLEVVKNDFVSARETLNALKRTKEGDKILLPVGGNAYLQAVVDTSESVLIGIGAGAIIKKSTDEAIKTVEEELQTLDKREKELISNIKFSEKQLEEIIPKLRQMQQKAKT